MRLVAIVSVVAVASVGAALLTCDRARPGVEQEEAALARIPGQLLDETVVVAWSDRAFRVAAAEEQALPFKGLRAFALMHLAMHDALNTVVPVYRTYLDHGRDAHAHPIAAATQAAHDVLLAEYPARAAELEAERQATLARIPEGAPRARGIELGKKVAAAILSARRHDHADRVGSYSFAEGPGVYQTTGTWAGFVLQPGFRFTTPFVLERPEQLRPPPPPALASAAYAAAFEEVKRFGRSDSSVRTTDQTAYAIWWMEFSETSFNRLARTLVRERHLHAWRAARLFALLNVALFDGYVAVWDAKYHYNHWRPETAVRHAELDGNPATEPDASWESLRPATPFPEYPSAHAASCSISAEVLRRTLGDRPFVMGTTSAPPDMPTRRFGSFAAAAAECADSRVRLGFHYRYSTDGGLALGRAVAARVADHRLGPR